MKFCFISLALLCGTTSFAASFNFDYATNISSLAQIQTQIGKYPHPRGGLFKSKCVKSELSRILSTHYGDYENHLAVSGCGKLEKEGDYVVGDVSQLHVGGYGSIFFVDVKKQKMYLFWLKSQVLEKDYQIYGDRSIPMEVMQSIARRMNTGWGHVATFTVQGENLVIMPIK